MINSYHHNLTKNKYKNMIYADSHNKNILYQGEMRDILIQNERSNPRRFHKTYFLNIGKKYLVEWIEAIYPPSKFDFGDSCKAAIYGVFSIAFCGTCGGAITSWAKKTYSWRKFCSDNCRNNDPNLSERNRLIWTPENKKSGVIARKQHYIENYGVEHNMQIPEVAKKSGEAIRLSRSLRSDNEKLEREKSYRQTRMPDTYHLVEDRDWLFDQYVTQENSVISISRKFDISEGAVKNAILRHEIPYTPEREYANFVSGEEQDYYDFIKSIRPDAVQSFRNGYELDVFIPELNLGFEYNGCYYHSEAYKNKLYHQNKVEHFHRHGIRLVQIWSDSWLYNQDRTKNFIKNILAPGKTIGARKCAVSEIDTTKYNTFLNEMHMQGSSGASVRYGLFSDGELLSVMGFKKVATNESKGGYELCRFANKNVVGGFSKLLKEFIRNFPNVSVYSFADLETVNPINNVYIKNGFVEVDRIPTDYKYYNPRSKVREHKFGWRKSSFEKLGYDIEGKTEVELALEAGLLKCWDSGKIVYELDIKLNNN